MKQFKLQKFGIKVVFNKWQGYGKQKRFGEQLCKHEWVLNLDGDEVLSQELVSSIRDVLKKHNNKFNFFYKKKIFFLLQPNFFIIWR